MRLKHYGIGSIWIVLRGDIKEQNGTARYIMKYA